ncbi:hypothetical protein [Micromonospora sp. NPDC004704]
MTLLGFLCFTGFLLDRYGELHWHTGRGGGYLLLLAAATVLGVAVGTIRRVLTGRRARFVVRSSG